MQYVFLINALASKTCESSLASHPHTLCSYVLAPTVDVLIKALLKNNYDPARAPRGINYFRHVGAPYLERRFLIRMKTTPCKRFMAVLTTFKLEYVIRGYHEYKRVWTPVLNEMLSTGTSSALSCSAPASLSLIVLTGSSLLLNVELRLLTLPWSAYWTLRTLRSWSRPCYIGPRYRQAQLTRLEIISDGCHGTRRRTQALAQSRVNSWHIDRIHTRVKYSWSRSCDNLSKYKAPPQKSLSGQRVPSLERKKILSGLGGASLERRLN